jgi:hypothetical protein
LLKNIAMTTQNRLTRWGAARLSRRLSRSIPIVGAIVAGVTFAEAMRRKGVFGGSVDTALNATPFLGAVKNTFEWARGRDLIADRQGRPAATAS